MDLQAQGKLQQLVHQFQEECQRRQLNVCPSFARFYIHLYVRDAHEGLKMNELTACRINEFVERAAYKYANPFDPTACNIKIKHSFASHFKKIDLDNFKAEYKRQLQIEMQPFIDGIIQYPETSSVEQLEDMFTKIIVFIIVYYCLGCPNSHILLKQTRQSLNSVITRGDLRNFLIKMKRCRLEYLERLTATVCGIMVYNYDGPEGNKENMRDISADIEMAKTNTIESIEGAIKQYQECKKHGYKAITELIELDTAKKRAHCHYPVQKVMRISKFIAMYGVGVSCMQKLVKAYGKTEYSIKVSQNKMKCIIQKIDDVLKYRTAIDSEVIFPHFIQLAEIWSELVMYLSELTAINKVKAKVDEVITPELCAEFVKLLQSTEVTTVQMKYSVEPTFEQLTAISIKRHGKGSLVKVADNVRRYCAMTIALTGGLLVPSTVQKKICEDSNLKFGFANIELAKYAERNFEQFICTLQNVIFTSVDLLLLFDLHNEILTQDSNEIELGPQSKTKNFESQTESVIENDLTLANQINFTWNIWDFHRQTIRLADLRKCQSHSTQTESSFGRRDAQMQANERLFKNF